MAHGYYHHGRCVPWEVGNGKRHQICDFTVHPNPHDQPPRWSQEHPPAFKQMATCSAGRPPCEPSPYKASPCGLASFSSFSEASCPRNVPQCVPSAPHPQHLPSASSLDEVGRDGRDGLNEMGLRFFVPPEFRQGDAKFAPSVWPQPRYSTQPQQQPQRCGPGAPTDTTKKPENQQSAQRHNMSNHPPCYQAFGVPLDVLEQRKPEATGWDRGTYPDNCVQHNIRLCPPATEKKNGTPQECCGRSMCRPEGMGSIDPNCQGRDYRIFSGYQPRRRGSAVDRCYDPCEKWSSYRNGASAGHVAAHAQKDDPHPADPPTCHAPCPEDDICIGKRSVYPKFGGMVPGYGGYVPGVQNCKFGKTFGRETKEVLKQAKSDENLGSRMSMQTWRSKCYNKEINC